MDRIIFFEGTKSQVEKEYADWKDRNPDLTIGEPTFQYCLDGTHGYMVVMVTYSFPRSHKVHAFDPKAP